MSAAAVLPAPRERPILFSAPMVRAIDEDRKSQTRRLLNPQPGEHHWYALPGYKRTMGLIETGNGLHLRVAHRHGAPGLMYEDPNVQWIRCPYGAPGDLLIPLTTWAVDARYDARKPTELPPDVLVWSHWLGAKPDFCGKNRPGRFMPLALRRCLPRLRVTSVRVERLGEISEEGAKAEGLHKLSKDGGHTWKYGIPDNDGLPGEDDNGWHWGRWHTEPRVAFAHLWASIHNTWQPDLWVWVVGFERVKS